MLQARYSATRAIAGPLISSEMVYEREAGKKGHWIKQLKTKQIACEWLWFINGEAQTKQNSSSKIADWATSQV